MSVCTSAGKPFVSTDSSGDLRTVVSLNVSGSTKENQIAAADAPFSHILNYGCSTKKHLLDGFAVLSELSVWTHGPFSFTWLLIPPLLTEAGQEGWL